MERNDLLSRIIPPGISLRAHGYALVIGNLVCLLFSSSFVGKLMSAYEKLYRFSGGKKVLVEAQGQISGHAGSTIFKAAHNNI